MLVSLPDGAAQGFEFGAHTWPRTEFPLGMPLTFQVTAVLSVPATDALKLARAPGARLAEAGETFTVITGGLATVTVAVALCVLAIASMVSGLAGAFGGAV